MAAGEPARDLEKKLEDLASKMMTASIQTKDSNR